MVKKVKLRLVKDDTPVASPRYANLINEYDNTVILPTNLHLVLPVTSTLYRSFRSEAEMTSYRRMIYTINKQGEYRYRTIRAETEMWGIVIWRMV